jgi:hypothetical protein
LRRGPASTQGLKIYSRVYLEFPINAMGDAEKRKGGRKQRADSVKVGSVDGAL